MNDRNVIQTGVDDFAKSAGYAKRNGSWYRRTNDTISVLDLQKSQYGRSYYLNIAIWLLPIEEAAFPEEQQCHIRTRLSSLVPQGEERHLSDLLDLDSNLTDDARAEQLAEALGRWLRPAVDATATVESLRSPAGAQVLSSSLVRASAQEFLTATR